MGKLSPQVTRLFTDSAAGWQGAKGLRTSCSGTETPVSVPSDRQQSVGASTLDNTPITDVSESNTQCVAVQDNNQA